MRLNSIESKSRRGGDIGVLVKIEELQRQDFADQQWGEEGREWKGGLWFRCDSMMRVVQEL